MSDKRHNKTRSQNGQNGQNKMGKTNLDHDSPYFCMAGTTRTRPLHRIFIAASERVHTRKQIKSFDAAMHMQGGNVSQALLSKIQLTHSCDSPNTFTFRVALGASNVSLVGANPTCSAPALKGCEGLYGHAAKAMHGMSTHTPLPYSLPVCLKI